MDDGQKACSTGEKQDWSDEGVEGVGQKGCSTGTDGKHDWWETILVGFRTGGMQDRRDKGQEGGRTGV